MILGISAPLGCERCRYFHSFSIDKKGTRHAYECYHPDVAMTNKQEVVKEYKYEEIKCPIIKRI